MALPQIMNSFLDSLEEGNLSHKTIEAYEINLNDFVDYTFEKDIREDFDYDSLNASHFLSWVSDREDLSASSKNQRIATLSKFYNYLLGEGVVTKNVVSTISKIKEDELYQRPVLTEEEFDRYLDKAREIALESQKYADYRNELIINLFLFTGLRIDELSRVSVGDIELEEGVGLLTVVGKRGKIRTVGIPSRILPLVSSYMKIRSLQKHSDDRALFLSRQKGKNGYRLSTDQIRRHVVSVAKEADVKSITPHSLRHTCATILVAKGVNSNKVSKLLGHSSVAITEKLYIHQTNRDVIDIANEFDNILEKREGVVNG